MAEATLRGTTLAQSDKYEMVEGNIYFPPDSVKWEYLSDGDREYTCPWKGETKYYDIKIGDNVASNAAWGYPAPKPAAANITGHLAFDPSVVDVRG